MVLLADMTYVKGTEGSFVPSNVSTTPFKSTNPEKLTERHAFEEMSMVTSSFRNCTDVPGPHVS